MENQSQAYYNI